MNRNNSRPRRRDRRNRETTQIPDSTNYPFPDGMIFYCRNRQQIVDIKPKTFDFSQELKEYAEKTATQDIPFNLMYGSERSIKQYFKISDEKFDQERRERELKANQADKYG